MENTGKAKFFAFISHKSRDRQFALKLQNFIESYNLPAKLRKKTNSPKYLAPLCSYEVDFSANPLFDEMRQKLRQSKYLILICSKDETEGGSPFVNFEIETFIACKQEEGVDPLTRIIPIAVDSPSYSTVEECCPAALKALGDNCPIILEQRKYKNDREVFLHAISGMLDIDYAVMVDRDKKRRVRKGLAYAGAALTAAVALGLLLNYMLPKKIHYLDFVMKNGAPVGIEELRRNEYTKISAHYVFTSQQGKITEVRYVNPEGKLIDHNGWGNADRPARYVFDYNSQGVSTVTYYNRNANPYFVMSYVGGSMRFADFLEGAGEYQTHYIGQGYTSDLSMLLADYAQMGDNGISRFVYEYDKDGYVTQITFSADSSGKRAHDDNVYGLQYEHDSMGRICKTYYMDEYGQRTVNKEGIYCKQFVYDADNNLAELKNLDSDGNLVEDSSGIVQLRRTFDNHNIICLEAFDAEGKPMIVSDYGGAKVEMTLNASGQTEIARIYDENGQPYAQNGYYGLQYRYDANGFETGYTYLDENFQPFFSEEQGYAVLTYPFDDTGNPLSYHYTDVDGTVVTNHSGYASAQVTYNERGQATQYAYYDAEGNLTDFKGYGYSVKNIEYDDRGRETLVYYLDNNLEPVNIKGPSYEYGFHKIQTDYEYGLFTKTTVSFYDKDGKLVNSKSQALGETYAQAVMIRQDGYITSIAYYDQDGRQYGERLEFNRTYNAQAEMIETGKWIDADGVLLSQYVTSYSMTGIRLREYAEEYRDGALERSTTRTFNDRDAEVSLEDISYDSDGNVLEKYWTEYDDEGNTIYIEIITPTDPEMYSFRRWTEYSEGVKVSERVQQNIADGVPGYELERSYDKSERVAEETFTNYEQGVLLNTVKTLYTYHEDGSWTQTRTLYADDGTVNFVLTEQYDSEGNLISEP